MHQGIFTQEWVAASFENYWEQLGQWATQWSNLLLNPSQDFINLLQAAGDQTEIAHQLADAFDDPSTLINDYKIKI